MWRLGEVNEEEALVSGSYAEVELGYNARTKVLFSREGRELHRSELSVLIRE